MLLSLVRCLFDFGETRNRGKDGEQPANTDADPTTAQLTSVKRAVVPIVAIAVCAIVFSARTPAALSHFVNFSLVMMILPSKLSLCESSHINPTIDSCAAAGNSYEVIGVLALAELVNLRDFSLAALTGFCGRSICRSILMH